MALPKIVRPRYEIKVPGYAPVVNISPFTIGEKKVLLSAIAFNDAVAFINAVADIVGNCSDVNVNDMPLHFVEYIFLQIYAKSTGGVITGTYTCSGIFTPPAKEPEEPVDGNDVVEVEPPQPEVCGFEMPVNIPLDMAIIDYGAVGGNEYEVRIEDVVLTLAVPPWRDMKEFVAKGKPAIDIGEDFVVKCVKSISSAEGTVTAADFNKEELVAWLEGLPSDAGDKISPFFNNLPVVTSKIPVTCPKCGTRRDIELRGLDDFFV